MRNRLGDPGYAAHRPAGNSAPGMAMRAGHPTSWGVITKGTCLEGTVYPAPGVVAEVAQAANDAPHRWEGGSVNGHREMKDLRVRLEAEGYECAKTGGRALENHAGGHGGTGIRRRHAQRPSGASKRGRPDTAVIGAEKGGMKRVAPKPPVGPGVRSSFARRTSPGGGILRANTLTAGNHIVELEFAAIRPAAIAQIDEFCTRHGLTPSNFGIRFAGDSHFVSDLRTPGYGVGLSRLETVARRANDYAESVRDEADEAVS